MCDCYHEVGRLCGVENGGEDVDVNRVEMKNRQEEWICVNVYA